MSHYMTALAMKQSGLKPAAKIVLYWIADHHNGETGVCFPSLSRLCECTEMGKTALTKHIDALEEMGLISRIRAKRKDGGWTSTSYTLHLIDPLVRKENKGCSENEQGLVRNANTNLGSNNLGKEHISAKADERFEEFWAVAPRKIAKGAARKAWAAAVKKADAGTIIEAFKKFAASQAKQDPKFIPHPATWLNAERWEDEAPAAAKKYKYMQDTFGNLLRKRVGVAEPWVHYKDAGTWGDDDRV